MHVRHPRHSFARNPQRVPAPSSKMDQQPRPRPAHEDESPRRALAAAGTGAAAEMEGTRVHGRLAMDGVSWFLNVSTSVLIVFVNKVLMDPKKGYGFTFATTLCAFHFLACAATVWVLQLMGLTKRATLPWREVLYFALVANVSIASLNLSLLLNSVGYYQIAKLLIIPFTCVIELVWLKRTFTPAVVTSIVAVIAGVGVVTISDLNINTQGLIVAGISVVSSSLQQILCGTIQRKHNLSAQQLLANTAPVQGIMLLVFGPWLDKALTGKWLLAHHPSHVGLMYLFLSCAVAVAVNISQFMCLGRFSAVTFQVLGHTKTVLVLLISWTGFQEHMSARKLFGMVLAVAGMVAYGYANSKAPTPGAKTGQGTRKGELLPLVNEKSRISDAGPVIMRVDARGGAPLHGDYTRLNGGTAAVQHEKL